ncbi:hypothetical protein [Bacillus sinesaloumensis]|uniref:hypothetical protein n=1 Tax=Litchfieldia sinesaloumensis TaxID=1926280 RepID=UPI0009883898|nr:hypothetical protein [Bacillus sinesaloumensis]
MYVVHYFENKNLLLTRLVESLPAVDEAIKVKGRKGKVIKITEVDEKNVHIQVEVDRIVKKKVIDDSKKRRR